MKLDNWRNVTTNLYGERVQESSYGARRVALGPRWVSGSDVPPARVCVVRNQGGYEQMVKTASLMVLDEAVNGSDVARIVAHVFNAWELPLVQNQGQNRHALFSSFVCSVKKQLASETAKMWLSGTLHWSAIAYDLLLWSAPCGHPLALQVGVAEMVKQKIGRASQGGGPRGKELLEQGAVSPDLSSSVLLPQDRVTVFSLGPGSETYAPQARLSDSWVTPKSMKPVNASGYQKGRKRRVVGSAAEDFQHILLWVTQSAVKKNGSFGLTTWFEYLARQGTSGVVVFDSSQAERERSLLKRLNRSSGKTVTKAALSYFAHDGLYRELDVNSGAKDAFTTEYYSIIDVSPAAHSGPTTVKVATGTMAQWFRSKITKKEPPVVCFNKGGRPGSGQVDYRSASGASSAVAPAKLEACMHKALLSSGAYECGADISVANLLGIPVQQLREFLKPEQSDAVFQALWKLRSGAGMILADETGFGKGRILAQVSLLALKEDKQVVFVTENASLFSDFYRDIRGVRSESCIDRVFLLHGAASILSGGEAVKRSDKDMFSSISSGAAGPLDPKMDFIWTTYAQVSRESSGGKLEWLLQQMAVKDTWVVLDEAHNAAGASNTSKNISRIINASSGVLFSSATFAKQSENLKAYRKAFDIPKWMAPYIFSNGGHNSELTSASLSHLLAGDGSLMRRERPPAPPPHVLVPSMSAVTSEAIERFSAIWRTLAASLVEASAGTKMYSPWRDLGAPLSRAMRELSLIVKADAIVDVAAAEAERGHKPIITVDSTMEAPLLALREKYAASNSDSSSSGPRYLWKERLGDIVDDLFPSATVLALPDKNSRRKRLLHFKEQINGLLSGLPDWSASPLDRVLLELERRSLRCAELSGRGVSLKLSRSADTSADAVSFDLVDVSSKNRSETVSLFNNGKLDVLIISRVGATGISLHASQSFEDRRPRTMIEWDVSFNPVIRKQFWGRIRRLDQVCEPKYISVWADLPYEKRIMERELDKIKSMDAHAGRYVSGSENWVSSYGGEIVTEWMGAHPKEASALGITHNMGLLERVDKALSRALILPKPCREGLTMRLSRGMQIAAKETGVDDPEALSQIGAFREAGAGAA